MTEPIRVLVVDDHRILREALKVSLETQPDLLVVGEADDGLAALAAVEATAPHVVLMDITMPGKIGGAEATRRIRASGAGTRVLALTAHDQSSAAHAMLEAGASGFLCKTSSIDELARALRLVASGGVYIDPIVAGALVQSTPPPSGDAARADKGLSAREERVLRMIAEGHVMKDIAQELGVSVRTLETYKARGLQKLGLKTRAELVRYAARRGWLTDG